MTKSQAKMEIVIARNGDQLSAHCAAWDDLALSALEPNVFYQSWHLLPAIRAFGTSDLRFVLIYKRETENAPRVLCGFFPLQRCRTVKGLPVGAWRLWKHLYCSLCTPLLRADCGRETLHAFFDWLAKNRSTPLLEMESIPAEGLFGQLWADFCREREVTTFTDECYTRALIRPAADSETYKRGALSGKRRKELKRQENRLTEMGRVEYAMLEDEGDVAPWIEEWLRLEAAGWKGEMGTAFASSEADRAFFQTIALEAFKRNRLMFLALRLDGRAIAMKFNLLAGDGAFACKIAFDENYARFSPGALLELHNIERLHAMPQIHWMDSCAITDHFMINRLWTERRLLQNCVVSGGRKKGDFVVSLLPLLRWFKRQIRRPKITEEK